MSSAHGPQSELQKYLLRKPVIQYCGLSSVHQLTAERVTLVRVVRTAPNGITKKRRVNGERCDAQVRVGVVCRQAARQSLYSAGLSVGRAQKPGTQLTLKTRAAYT